MASALAKFTAAVRRKSRAGRCSSPPLRRMMLKAVRPAEPDSRRPSRPATMTVPLVTVIATIEGLAQLGDTRHFYNRPNFLLAHSQRITVFTSGPAGISDIVFGHRNVA